MAVLCAAVAGCSTAAGPEPTAPADPGGFGSEARAPAPRAAPPASRASASDLRTIYFEFDDSSLRPDAKDDLRHNSVVLRDNPNLRIEIQGHCDERGSNEYNLALGSRRADSAKRYLIDLGVSPSRINTVSFGEERPAVRGHNELAWAKNRRAESAITR